ncbi:MAG: DUF4405 domain-containing protein [Bacteroidota bacterium]|nr:DUF4405 domain-containing protein [Bacteroidota bacterium]
MLTGKDDSGTAGSKKTMLPSRRLFIIYLDTFLLITLLLLLSPRMTGLPWHECLGIIFLLPVLLHLLLAWPWIRKSTRSIFNKARRRTRFNYFLNATLFTLVIIEIVSGLAISQVALPFTGVKTIDDRSWRALHNQTLNWTVLFAGLHIAVNWEWIVAAFRKRFPGGNKSTKKRIQIAPKLLVALSRTAIILLAAGIIAFALYGILGEPSLSRLYSQDEVARFRPGIGHGIGQFAGESLLIAIVAYIARRWLRVGL